MKDESLFEKILVVLALIGAAISVWLLNVHIDLATGNSSLGSSCSMFDTSGGCESVALSKYSLVFGIPLPAIALGYYIGLALLMCMAWFNPSERKVPLYASFNMATLAVVVTVIMAFIAKFKLQSFCLGCAGLWLVNLTVWPLLVKALGLNWGNALGANFETLKLNQEKVLKAFGTTVGCLAVTVFFSWMMSASGAKDSGGNVPTDATRQKYRNSAKLFLPEEAHQGVQSKGAAKEKAVLNIVKFSDFQCPACKRAAQMAKPFLIRHKDKVRYSYRHFPLDASCNPFAPNGGHRMACAAAKASICAGDQGKFFAAHDQIFDNQTSLNRIFLKELAKKNGMDEQKFMACLTADSTKERLQKEMAWGKSIDMNSTPTFVVNGRKFAGGLNPKQWEALLKEAEKEQK